jgi:hypothetical protein
MTKERRIILERKPHRRGLENRAEAVRILHEYTHKLKQKSLEFVSIDLSRFLVGIQI